MPVGRSSIQFFPYQYLSENSSPTSSFFGRPPEKGPMVLFKSSGKLLRGIIKPMRGRVNQPRLIRTYEPVTVAGIGPWLVIDRLKKSSPSPAPLQPAGQRSHPPVSADRRGAGAVALALLHHRQGSRRLIVERADDRRDVGKHVPRGLRSLGRRSGMAHTRSLCFPSSFTVLACGPFLPISSANATCVPTARRLYAPSSTLFR
jgi:hypothetical protein